MKPNVLSRMKTRPRRKDSRFYGIAFYGNMV